MTYFVSSGALNSTPPILRALVADDMRFGLAYITVTTVSKATLQVNTSQLAPLGFFLYLFSKKTPGCHRGSFYGPDACPVAQPTILLCFTNL